MSEEAHEANVRVLGEQVSEEEEDHLAAGRDALPKVGPEREPDWEEQPTGEETGSKQDAQLPGPFDGRHVLFVGEMYREYEGVHVVEDLAGRHEDNATGRDCVCRGGAVEREPPAVGRGAEGCVAGGRG